METLIFVPLTEDEYRRLLSGAYHTIFELEALLQQKFGRAFAFTNDFADEIHRLRFVISAPYLSRKFRDGDTVSTAHGWVFTLSRHHAAVALDDTEPEEFVLQLARA